MAIPTTYSGIEVEVVFASGWTCEIERDTSGAFGSAVTVAVLTTGGTRRYTDSLPVTATDYYYRAKTTRDGYTDSSWSSTVGPVRATVLS